MGVGGDADLWAVSGLKGRCCRGTVREGLKREKKGRGWICLLLGGRKGEGGRGGSAGGTNCLLHNDQITLRFRQIVLLSS